MTAGKTTLRLDDFLPYRLSVASNRVSSAIATAYQALFGLRIAEWRLIAVIAEGQGMTQQALGAATRMDKVTVSRAAIALVDRGLVARQPNAQDQRSHLLSLTAAGQDLYESVAPKALELEARIFGGFSPKELAAFRAVLDRLEASAAALDPE
ncbi:MarR family winged helix-turn-helix transcriptional regulator [Sphingomonas hylomeconis]|uniref:MarR family winged helix-turn-helix transcriptional regulator n=1 Tax=Sphingomonas hylomeconis TaxID=1395958 RepID=A0ABV7SYI3_9SPHN|nr:MarR family winged helix-turn-helix transcriptional regulator [Sphingomonas hylomeconis]